MRRPGMRGARSPRGPLPRARASAAGRDRLDASIPLASRLRRELAEDPRRVPPPPPALRDGLRHARPSHRRDAGRPSAPPRARRHPRRAQPPGRLRPLPLAEDRARGRTVRTPHAEERLMRYAVPLLDLDAAWRTISGSALVEAAVEDQERGDAEVVTVDDTEAVVLRGPGPRVAAVVSGLVAMRLPGESRQWLRRRQVPRRHRRRRSSQHRCRRARTGRTGRPAPQPRHAAGTEVHCRDRATRRRTGCDGTRRGQTRPRTVRRPEWKRPAALRARPDPRSS